MKKALLESGQHKLDGRPIHFSLTKTKGDITSRLGCWFCLDNPEADKSLVAYENDHVYLALDKGPIEKFHFLMIPQNHKSSWIALNQEEKSAFNTCEAKLFNFYEAEKRSFIKCERHFKLNKNASHMIVHLVSFPQSQFSTLELMFMSSVRDVKLDFFELKNGDVLESLVRPEDLYISLTFVDTYTRSRKTRVCILTENLSAALPPDFLRTFVCRMLDLNSRKDWRGCLRSESDTDFMKQRLSNFMTD